MTWGQLFKKIIDHIIGPVLMLGMLVMLGTCAWSAITTKPAEPTAEQKAQRAEFDQRQVLNSLPPEAKVVKKLGNGWYVVDIPCEGVVRRFMYRSVTGGQLIEVKNDPAH